MTAETRFDRWIGGFAEANGISSADLHYELLDPQGERRLQEVVVGLDDENSGDSSDEQPFLEFDPHSPHHEIRYRYDRPGEVRRWCTVAFEVEALHRRTLDENGDYTFQIGFWMPEAQEAPASPDDEVDSVTIHRGGLDNPQTIRAFRVAGLSEQRDAIREFLEAGRDRWGLSPETGMLLEGPPGTGKTELVMEICREEYGAVPVEISGPEILSRWVGESERILRERFEQARSNPSNVLYIDEIDSIARSRGRSSQEYSAQIVAQLLVLLDGIGTKREETPVRVIASTNMAELIDEALRRPGRLGRTERFDRLAGDDALAVLHHYLEQIHRNRLRREEDEEISSRGKLSPPLERFVTEAAADALDQQDAVDDVRRFLTHRTGAEIEQLVQRGTRLADATSESPELELDHLFDAATDEAGEELVTAADVGVGRSAFIDSRVLRVRPDEGIETVEDEFRAFLRNQDDHDKGVLRTLDPDGQLFSADEDFVWNQVWERFRPERGYPVCVYLDGYDRVARAMEYSSIAEVLVEALCERLVAGGESASPPIHFAYASADDSGTPRLEQFSR